MGRIEDVSGEYYEEYIDPEFALMAGSPPALHPDKLSGKARTSAEQSIFIDPELEEKTDDISNYSRYIPPDWD